MAAQTGRTVERFIRFVVGDSADTLREIPIESINDVGLAFDMSEVTALQDAIKNSLSAHPSAPITIGGPLDNSAAVANAASGATPALSGSHTVLKDINGDNKPHTLQVLFGIRHYWETGEPVFGLQRATASNSGYTCTKYTVSGNKYSAEFQPMGGIAPAWGTSMLTAGA